MKYTLTIDDQDDPQDTIFIRRAMEANVAYECLNRILELHHDFEEGFNGCIVPDSEDPYDAVDRVFEKIREVVNDGDLNYDLLAY